MNAIKKLTGIISIVACFGAIWFLWSRAGAELSAATVSPDKKIFWYTILPVYTPLMLGLGLFGWWALKGEYDSVAD